MKSRRAFTLIEVLFAMTLILAAALIVGATMPVANVSRAKSMLNDRAMGVAQKELEAIRGLGYANVSAQQLANYGLLDGTGTVATNTYSFTNSDAGNYDNPATVLPGGTGTVMIEQIDLELRRVTVTVNWLDRGVAKSFTVGTLIANI